MLQLNNLYYSGVSRSRLASPCLSHVLPTRRPVRQPRLGVCAFKDWFTGLVQPHKETQPQHQPASQASTQELQLAQPSLQPASKTAPKRDFLEARQVSLLQLFDSSDYKFDIPTYQRPYAWRTKQIYELIQDFVKAYESRQEYFLGAIVATRAADGSNEPYQLIDGQQRLTSLVLLLAFLHSWTRKQGNDVLEGRIRRMLFLEADPLEPGSNGRYRLRLRDTDDEFFRSNILDDFLPKEFRLAGLAAEAAGEVNGAGAACSVDTLEATPLENETWWRLYENASFLRIQLDKFVSEGLNLQDFAFHVLRNCFVVLMVARDEGASFRIFSTLNGRGMDLSVVDKLKADLLAGELTSSERSHFADAWAEMESVLGRTAFHRVFDYMRELAAVRDPGVWETSMLEYFTRRVDDPSAVKQVLQVALDYGRLLLQLRQASWDPPELAAMLAESPTEQLAWKVAARETRDPARDAAVSAAVQGAFEQATVPVITITPEMEDNLLEHLHEQHRQWQDKDVINPVVEAVGVCVETSQKVELVAQEPLSASVPPPAIDNDVIVFRFDKPSAPPLEALPVLPTALASATDEAASLMPPTEAGNDLAAVSEVLSQPPAVTGQSPPTNAPGDGVVENTLVVLDQLGEEQLLAAASAVYVSDAITLPMAVPLNALEATTETPAQVEQLLEQLGEQQPSVITDFIDAEENPVEGEREQQAALLAELDMRSRYLNLFTDEAWLPPLLEFFYQSDDLKARAAFMKSAEALQLLLELQGDPAVKAARWGAVSDALLQRPFRSEAVLLALRLTDKERALFRARLDSKDLHSTADQRTLRHLLARCEPPSVCSSLSGQGGLVVERVMPQSAPEGSMWRKTRITSLCDPQSAWPDPWFTNASSFKETSETFHELDVSPGAADNGPETFEVKYWYEVQRLNWHGKLGNLVLLPATATSASSATADYDAKAALWRKAGVLTRLPGFTGPLVDERGRYGRFRFCFDECRQRHADMLAYLIAEFELYSLV